MGLGLTDPPNTSMRCDDPRRTANSPRNVLYFRQWEWFEKSLTSKGLVFYIYRHIDHILEYPASRQEHMQPDVALPHEPAKETS